MRGESNPYIGILPSPDCQLQHETITENIRMQIKMTKLENFLLFTIMREEVTIEINGEKILIGYSSMYFPANHREQEQGLVFKSLRLEPIDKNQEGDIFYFQNKKKLKYGEWKNDWYLLPEYCFLNTESPLIDLYMSRKYSRKTTFDDMVEYVFRHHYWTN